MIAYIFTTYLFPLCLAFLFGVIGFNIPLMFSRMIYGPPQKSGTIGDGFADLPEAFFGMFFAGAGIVCALVYSGTILNYFKVLA
jgi:hypothetical protein